MLILAQEEGRVIRLFALAKATNDARLIAHMLILGFL